MKRLSGRQTTRSRSVIVARALARSLRSGMWILTIRTIGPFQYAPGLPLSISMIVPAGLKRFQAVPLLAVGTGEAAAGGFAEVGGGGLGRFPPSSSGGGPARPASAHQEERTVP